MARSITQRVVRNARKRGANVYTRRQWRCPNLAVYAWRRKWKKHAALPSDTLWCHITVTNPSPKGIKEDMRVLHRIGMERFGSGVSYNFAIRMDTGAIGLGQALDAKGTHTINVKGVKNYSYDQNYVSHAFAFVGMPNTYLSYQAKKNAARLIAALIDEQALNLNHDFNPHSMVAYKDCPCDAARDAMPEILDMAKRMLAADNKRKR